MGYCNGDCEKLNRRYHRCDKYHQKLTYMKQSGAISFSVHEQCNECQNDEHIKSLEKELRAYKDAEEQGLLFDISKQRDWNDTKRIIHSFIEQYVGVPIPREITDNAIDNLIQ